MTEPNETQFRDLDDFLEVEPLVLPIHGKDYTFPGEMSGRTWLKVQRLGAELDKFRKRRAAGEDVDPATEVVTDLDQTEMMEEMFAGTHEQMAADGVSSAAMRLVLMTLMAFHLEGRDAALAVWNNRGEAPAPNRAARRAPTRPRGNSRVG